MCFPDAKKYRNSHEAARPLHMVFRVFYMVCTRSDTVVSSTLTTFHGTSSEDSCMYCHVSGQKPIARARPLLRPPCCSHAIHLIRNVSALSGHGPTVTGGSVSAYRRGQTGGDGLSGALQSRHEPLVFLVAGVSHAARGRHVPARCAGVLSVQATAGPCVRVSISVRSYRSFCLFVCMYVCLSLCVFVCLCVGGRGCCTVTPHETLRSSLRRVLKEVLGVLPTGVWSHVHVLPASLWRLGTERISSAVK